MHVLQVMEAARQRADAEPLRLSKNWVAAVCVFLIWDALLLWGLKLGFQWLGSAYWAGRWWLPVLVAGAVLVLAEGIWTVLQLRAEQLAAAPGFGEDDPLKESLNPSVV